LKLSFIRGMLIILLNTGTSTSILISFFTYVDTVP
jgi:hypothetical protein